MRTRLERLRRLFNPSTWGRSRWRVDRPTYRSVVEVPDRIPRNTAVIVEKSGTPVWLILGCPCGQGHRVMLNLDPAERPVWRLTRREPMTLMPSVDETTVLGRCHYFINGGRVKWV